MAKYFMLKEPDNLLEDCALNANIITKLTETDRFRLIDEVGTWYYVKTSTGQQGWINTFKNNTKNVIEDYKAGSIGIKIGDFFTVKSDSNYSIDYNENQIQVIQDDTPIIFRVEDIEQKPDRVSFHQDGILYTFLIDDIESDSLPKDQIFRFDLRTFDGDDSDSGANKEAGETDANAKEKADAAYSLSSKEKESLSTAIIDAINYTFNENHDYKLAQQLNSMNITNLQGVFGMPYQFTDIADMRLETDWANPDTAATNANPFTSFGSKYAEKIIARMPLFTIVPGNAKFLPKYSDDQKSAVMNLIKDPDGKDPNKNGLKKLLNDGGQYYNFFPAWADYYKYVNPMCRIAAVLLKIDNIKIPSAGKNGMVELGSYRWEDVGNNPIQQSLAFKGSMCFYLNADNQVSESFSNGTTQSALADKINSISDKVREMQFLMGASTGLLGSTLGNSGGPTDKETGDSSQGKSTGISGFISGMFGGSKNTSGTADGMLSSIMSGMSAVVQGSKMRFPEIWEDSQYSKDYNVSMKFMTPDCDNLSVYLNVIVPLIHVICLAAPRATGVNAYGAPFLVRCFYRGFFNIDIGIVTSLSINKGGDGKWSYSNIPTEVEVNMTIKDLYNVMAIPMNDSDNVNGDISILSNNTLMDYMCNMCGVNFTEIDMGRTITLYKILIENKFKDFIPNVAESLTQWAYDKYIRYTGQNDYR